MPSAVIFLKKTNQSFTYSERLNKRQGIYPHTSFLMDDCWMLCVIVRFIIYIIAEKKDREKREQN